MTDAILAPDTYQRTTYAVWELTLKCNLACGHCGSRAGEARPNELSTAEALDLVRQLAEVGIREVTLIGGEAYLRRDWLTIAEAISAHGMVCTMVTGGLGVSAAMAAKMAAAGLFSISVSLDGLEATHDALRGVPGSWRAALNALRVMREAGLAVAVNTQINRRSRAELEGIYELVREAGAHSWQVQLTVPMGRAADDAELILQPYELLELFPQLAELAERGQRDGVSLRPGNNVGYYGPYETLLRGAGNADLHWVGCQAGVQVLGIEADGAIKGCPSLPTTPYVGGNVRDLPLSTIVGETEALTFSRRAQEDAEQARRDLWGFCGSCYYADVCRGGCTWTAHSTLGQRGNNPFCHHRALELAALGLRERLEPDEPAPGLPFDHGRMRLVLEPLPTKETVRP